MATAQETLWSRFLEPLFGLMVDREALKEFSDSIDWELECDRLKTENLVYPEYYLTQNFHGIEGGYLTS